ncbi:dual specificity protein phosphatase [Ferrimonas balearica DSM 9799]|uniref:Dual specificity protein phosphatase n=1 Tax=Ferrimonas balearica (strain DSM 9799 / CCM 4581 / KCTC 23876 / PAT) TaxID=550540 RepID=E1SUF3_FERBD|nr:dual specificity protein phosphatase family protein [Ferrimonas balearica]MBY6017764.1 dual specificity protein phosphatase family protein [Halomonas denitrificans]ADN77260.1 dual specificity protein phosphatase [Ferrimonas balearica DSM 9799]MBW3139746.1 dual specificity protein phosphatase family protein [Ferrimonas balearica]MBW3164770.1 dual specificity protein phosphatase family protein [Ferrimonas balearica]MBY5980366.1 dual specificity protein phosphatase family protein [Ferrimonas b
MEHLFWLEPGRIAGRSGPNKDPWTTDELQQAGIRTVLSLNDADGVDASELAEAGICHHHVALPGEIPPRQHDLDTCLLRLPQALARLNASLSQGERVLIHCRSGKDRTGMLMAYLLMVRQGLAPRDAMAKVRQVRPIAFSADGWEALTLSVLERLAPHH